ncbi:MAG: ABC transporter ATP-binding protein, partial [Planctomycetes bacterium]|nr:ABC transporter ATP-binding protein [Planctomycetota bacterium]
MIDRKKRLDQKIDDLLAEQHFEKGKGFADMGRLWRNYLSHEKINVCLVVFFTAIWCAHGFFCARTWQFLVDDALRWGRGFEYFHGEHLAEAKAMAAKLGLDMASASFDLQVEMAALFFTMNMIIWSLWLASNYGRSGLVLRFVKHVIYKMRNQLHDKLQALHVGYFEKNPTGRIMSRILDDVNVVDHWLGEQGAMIIAHTLKLSMGLCFLFWINYQMAAIAVFSLPFYAYSFRRLRPAIRKASIAMRRINSKLYALSTERISSVQVVKAFCQEIREKLRFSKLVHDSYRIGMRLVRLEQGLGFIAGSITALTTGMIYYIGIKHIQDGSMSLGSLLAFTQALGYVFEPVEFLTSSTTALEGMLVVLRRIFMLLDEDEELQSGKIRLSGMKGKIYFDNVSFTYEGQQSPSLKNVSFRIKHGMRVALMGPSGSGKSTIFQLLLRFYDPQDGAVRVGGVNLVDADTGSLRRHVRMVQQEPTVFSGTIAENVAYGKDETLPDQIMKAAKQAELHEFIMTLPAKYETEIGENGVTLSGGQRQRLALATALITDPEVLLLDDTTSALDAETEARIRSTLNHLLKDRTSLIITQRIATARDCDMIIVLENGEIAQQGTHAELSAAEGWYKRIVEQ